MTSRKNFENYLDLFWDCQRPLYTMENFPKTAWTDENLLNIC